jgi:CheY-like chemotaxis protein
MAPDIALVDLGLPGMDGYELAKRLRAGGGRGVFLVAVTGYGGREDRERAIAAGFDAHMTKPLGTAELEELLANARSPESAD